MGKVTFGVITQLTIENSPELSKVMEYCKQIALPTSLRDLGFVNIEDSKLKVMSELLVKERQVIETMPWLSSNDIYIALDKLR